MVLLVHILQLDALTSFSPMTSPSVLRPPPDTPCHLLGVEGGGGRHPALACYIGSSIYIFTTQASIIRDAPLSFTPPQGRGSNLTSKTPYQR